MKDDKKLTTEFEDEVLNDDDLDNVASGVGFTMTARANANTGINIYIGGSGGRRPIVASGDTRTDVDPAYMSAAFINGEITGGEDF